MIKQIKYGLMASKTVDINVTDICPKCGRAADPTLIHSHVETVDSKQVVFLTLFCTACKKSWVDSYTIYERDYHTDCYPEDLNFYKDAPQNLPKNIAKISETGAKTYVQALQAEIDGYDMLVGIGFRKALEFFVKDFLITKHPEKSKDITSAWLGKLINEYIDNTDLKNLATACAYLGNDETHYIRRYTEHDVSDLKRFLQATLLHFDFLNTVQESADFVDRATSR